MARKVEFFGLSTCGWCQKTKNWLDERGVAYDLTYVDRCSDNERTAAQDRMKKFAERAAFPLLIIDDGAVVIQGFHPEQFEEALKK